MLIRLSDFQREQGRCWIAKLPPDLPTGDSSDAPIGSPFRLFQGQQEIGPAHSLHEDIRRLGGGRFSHWQNALYFSTLDDRDPREQEVYVLTPISDAESASEEKLVARRLAESDCGSSLFFSQWMARSGSETQTLASLRQLEAALQAHGGTWQDKTILEVGASPSLGLALALAMLGARHVTANNVLPISARVPTCFLQSLYALLSLTKAPTKSWEDVTLPCETEGWREVDPRLIEVIDRTDAALIGMPDRKFDVVCSFSVLEHVRQLPNVLVALSDCMSADGLSVHFVDMRDHTDFSDPLKYLRLSEGEFQREYGPEHNRWRASDYLRMFDEAGLEIVRRRYAGELPLTADGQTDMYALALRGLENMFSERLDDLAPVTGETLAQLHPDFGKGADMELRALALEIIARRGGPE